MDVSENTSLLIGRERTIETPNYNTVIERREADDQNAEIDIKTESDQNTDNNDNKFSFSKVSREKKILLVCMGFVNFSCCACFALLAPFFPQEAERKGTSQSTVGFIFGAFEVAMFITAPIYGNFITRIGARFMFLSGIFVCGTCAILFGTLDKSPDGDIYILMCFLCRSIEGMGGAAFVTASFAIITHAFPNNVATVLGSLETFSGIGLMVGPTIGSTLYVAGGYGLPFFVMGGILIVCALVCARIMPKIDDTHKPFSGSVLTLFRSPLCLVTAASIVCGAMSLGLLDATFANHLTGLKLSQIAVGFIFFITPALYAITAPVWGWLGDSKGLTRTLIIGGNVLAAVSLFMIGPSPLTPFCPFAIWSTVIALIILGTSLGCALIPTFGTLFEGARKLGMEDSFDTYGIVSGLFNSCFSLGAFIGPTAGGAVVDKYNFPIASTGCAFLFLIAGLLMLGCTVIEKYSKCMSSPSNIQVAESNEISDETDTARLIQT